MTSTSPIFVFDSREQWFPVGVEESLRAAKPLGATPDCDAPRPFAKALDFPGAMKPIDLPAVGYSRLFTSGPLWWTQRWLWYLYNPGPPILAGVGQHEGDWEFVQTGETTSGTPVLMTCSQHHAGGKREAWACERRDGRPVIYVGLGSHANFFTPGHHAEDVCDGKGRVLDDIEWRPFGAWKDWPGRWGNSTGEGRSPESPARQHGHRWSAPHLFHSSAVAQ